MADFGSIYRDLDPEWKKRMVGIKTGLDGERPPESQGIEAFRDIEERQEL